MIARVILFIGLCAASVQAFSRIASSRSATFLQAKSKSVPFLEAPKNLDESMAGYAGFDPAGFTDRWAGKDWSEQIVPDVWADAAPRTTKITTTMWMQEAEIKHGRTAMLAVLGWVAVDSGLRFPGSEKVTGSIANSLAAHDAAVANGSMGVLLLLCFVMELAGGAALFEQAKGSGRKIGDFGFDPLGFSKNDAMAKKYR